MASRFGRLATRTGILAAPAASYLATHPEERQKFTTALSSASETVASTASAAAPIIRSALYIPPRVPVTPEDEIKYRTDFGIAISQAKARGYTDSQSISSSERDNLLKEIFSRATYFATKAGYKEIPTTIGDANKLYVESKKGFFEKAGDWASWATSKLPFTRKTAEIKGGKRRSRARRSKRRRTASRRRRASRKSH